MKIRIKFGKMGPVKFIGHLDMMRYFQKAFRRAGLDMTLSQGYHPHPIMSFASPLGLGIESIAEYMDIEVNSAPSMDEMKDMINAQMAEGIYVYSVKALADDAKNSMSMFAGADYSLRFRDGIEKEDSKEVISMISQEEIDSFLAQPQIMVRKKTKKNEIDMDIRPLIYEMKLDGDQIFLQLSAGSSANLKPELLMQAFCACHGYVFDEYQYLITRLEMYADGGSEKVRKLVSLDDFQTL